MRKSSKRRDLDFGMMPEVNFGDLSIILTRGQGIERGHNRNRN